MNKLLLRGSKLLLVIGSVTVLLSGCAVGDVGYGYGYSGGDLGMDYYAPYGSYYGGWNNGYQIGPFRDGGYGGYYGGENGGYGGDRRNYGGEHGGYGGEHGGNRGNFGGSQSHPYRSAPGSRSMPSIPGSHSRNSRR